MRSTWVSAMSPVYLKSGAVWLHTVGKDHTSSQAFFCGNGQEPRDSCIHSLYLHCYNKNIKLYLFITLKKLTYNPLFPCHSCLDEWVYSRPELGL